ncbi:MAG: hypothetical protein LBM02_06445 [Lachnospiraceae bacterium]|jgi:membrane protein implicated in regulation of membrane protease activity|nr:hypothetical protein [Lachnospiraceae bacterium]
MENIGFFLYGAILGIWIGFCEFIFFLLRHPLILIVFFLVVGFLIYLVVRLIRKVLKRGHEMAKKVIDKHFEVVNKKVNASIKIEKANNEADVINAKKDTEEK